MATITLDGNQYEVKQAKFRKWLELIAIREYIDKETEHPDKQASLICQYVTVSLSISINLLESNWKEVAMAFVSCVEANAALFELPFMKSMQSGDKPSWDYKTRSWWSLCRMLAKEFGWTVEYISELEVETAFSLIQELLIEEQLEKEWQWLLSDRAAKYNEATKKYEPNPLPRPDWMKETPKPAKRVKIPPHLMPMGVVVRARPDDQDYFTN